MPADKSRRAAIVLRLLEALLLTTAVLALGWYGTVRIAATREQASLSRELDLSRASIERTSLSIATADAPIAPHAPVARIEVPRLKLSAVAREGIDVRTLRIAVGHIPGTALPGPSGNAGFAAHRDTFFRPLKQVQPGDDVIVTTRRGTYRYVVTRTRVVEPADISVLDPTAEPTLTLVTCYPFDYIGSAPKRFIVQAVLQPARW